MYAIVDIETTGLNPVKDRIIEIAAYIFDGQQIVKEYSTLINPERIITANITRLTGITNEMVKDAPKFWEIAKDFVLLTEGKTFVAHNVNFDYNFIKNEFKSLGFDFRRRKLCTVKLSRRLIPGLRSYSLGKLCDDLGIIIEGRHRAAGDALATTKLFELLMEREKQEEDDKGLYNLPMSREFFNTLPQETGVYYFHDQDSEVIYIGKSTNIHSRVLSHFNNSKSAKANRMIEETRDISYELTGSELIALLKESSEIKDNKPKFNRAQRRSRFNYGIFSLLDDHGYTRLRADNTSSDNDPEIAFSTLKETKERLFKLCEEYELCQKLCGLYDSAGACFYHGIGQCNGACDGKELPGEYNGRVEEALNSIAFEWQNFFIIDMGRNIYERSVVQVEKGKYMGYGYIDIDNNQVMFENLKEAISFKKDNKDVRQIIRTFLKKKQVEKIIPY